MRNGWPTTTLGQLCTLVSGQHIDSKDYNTESRGVGYLTGPSDFGPLNPVISKWTEHPKIKAKRGDILITVKGSGVGKINLLDRDEVAISRQLMAVRVTSADPRFVHAILSSTFDHFQSLSTGAAIPGISRDQVLGLKIDLPPLPEQQRIVRILDEAFEGIATAKANAERNLQNARGIFESHLRAVFAKRGKGWTERRLGDIAKTQYGLSEPMNEEGKGFKIFRMGEVQGGRLIDTGRMKCADIDRSEFEKYKLHIGDVLFNRTNSFELVGKTGIFDLRGDYCFASYLVRVLLNKKVMLPRLLNYFMNAESFQASVKGKASKSINQANINATILANENVRFPESLEEQGTIVATLDALRNRTEGLESLYQQKLTALDSLKKSLLHQAFTGNL